MIIFLLCHYIMSSRHEKISNWIQRTRSAIGRAKSLSTEIDRLSRQYTDVRAETFMNSNLRNAVNREYVRLVDAGKTLRKRIKTIIGGKRNTRKNNRKNTRKNTRKN